MAAARLSIIVPALDEAVVLPALLDTLAAWRARGDEVVLVDGGSGDATRELATGRVDRVLTAPRGRAAQLSAGAAAARGGLLWFVHADTVLGDEARAALLEACAAGARWGRFDVTIDDPAWPFRVIERAMNLRSRVTGIATGDQAMFVERALFEQVGGFAAQPQMEDIDLAGRLRRVARPACLRVRVRTSARRWRRRGILRTVLLMWSLRLAWFCGVPARRLARLYG